MLEQRIYAMTDEGELRALIADHPWATLISCPDEGGPAVSHLPVLADPDPEGLAIVGHLARTDALRHELGAHDVVVVIQGPHGYVSPSMYRTGPYVPTWNFVVAHLHGRPELLDAAQTYQVLGRTVDHFEAVRPEPWRLESVAEYARSIAPHTTGFRLRPSLSTGKRKLSQEKPPEVARRVIDALNGDDPHRNPALAEAMQRALVHGE
jgi:transcriptional regulator